MCGDGVGQAARILDAGQRGQDLGGHLLVELHVVLELRQDGAPQGFDLGRDRILVMDVVQLAREVLALGVDVGDACAADALDQHLDGTVGQLQELQDVGNAANAIDVAGGGVVLRAVLLGNQHDALAGFHGRFQRLDGTLAAHEERDHHVGEDHHIAQGQQWQGLVGNMAIVHRFPEKCADRCTRDRPGRQGSAYEASGDDSKRLQEYAEVVASFLMKPCPAGRTAGRRTGGRRDPSEGGAFCGRRASTARRRRVGCRNDGRHARKTGNEKAGGDDGQAPPKRAGGKDGGKDGCCRNGTAGQVCTEV